MKSVPDSSVHSHALTLMLIALFASISLAVTRWLTNEQILANQRAKQQSIITQLLPTDNFDNDPFSQKIEFNDSTRGALPAYAATLQNKTGTVIVETYTDDGYNGRIDMLVAVNADLSIAGVRITRHLETPGLGDDIDHRKSDWIDTFREKSLANPSAPLWAVRRDGGQFDQFTGATITPRAVVNAVKNTLINAEMQYHELFRRTADK